VGTPLTKERPNITTLPLALLENASFPQVLYAAGLVSSKSEGHRLIKAKGAYVVLPNSGSDERPFHLKWDHIPEAADPNKYLIDFEALVLRSGKSKIRVCRIVNTERFEEKGLSFPGWDELKAKLEESAAQQPTKDVSTKQPEENVSASPLKE
jgi:tyrosyl-tRNA synthetase